jgi:hypothetical protein
MIYGLGDQLMMNSLADRASHVIMVFDHNLAL